MEEFIKTLKLLGVLSKHMHILKFHPQSERNTWNFQVTKCAIANSIRKIWPRLNPSQLVWIS